MSDFFMAYKIIFNNIRMGRKADFRRTSFFYDMDLQNSIEKMLRIYLPLLVFFAGLVIFLSVAVMLKFPLKYLEVTFVFWIIIHVLIVTPLIYKIMLPKNIKSHIYSKSLLSKEDLEALQEFEEEKFKPQPPEQKHKYGYLP